MLRVLIVEDSPDRQEVLLRLAKDHAWILVNTAERAVRLLESYPFDLIFLDFDLAGDQRGDRVAGAIHLSRNNGAKVIVHSQNKTGADRIADILPGADIVPLSKITRNNATFKRLRDELNRGTDINWGRVFSSR